MAIFTPEIGEQVCAHLTYGFSLRQIEKIEGMPTKRIILYWLFQAEALRLKEEKTDYDNSLILFLNHYALAREAQADALAEEIIEISDESHSDTALDDDGKRIVNMEHIQRDRLRVDSRKWLAGKLRPKKYGDKVTQEQTGVDGGPIEHVFKWQV